MYFDAVLDGPSGLSSREDEMFSVTLPDGKKYVDDQLTEAETYVLLGTYVCEQVMHFSGVNHLFLTFLCRLW